MLCAEQKNQTQVDNVMKSQLMIVPMKESKLESKSMDFGQNIFELEIKNEIPGF